jgi:CDP-paratose 2-epimerase
MPARTALVTGSSGLIGSEAVTFLDERGWTVHGVDNNMRREFFGEDGDTTWVLERIRQTTSRFTHHDVDIRDRAAIMRLVAEAKPDLVFHWAAQPSHDLAASRPFDDFEINAMATLNLLEAAREHCPDSPFVFMSTNKVYGDAPNELPLVELKTRWDYADEAHREGIDETCRIDGTMHSLFGASKAAADLLVQEYGRYFGMPTVCFRGGCLTGQRHSGAELHGFLSYMARAIREGRTYRIFGYKGKQVRDNIHSYDVCTAMLAYYEHPRPAAVYNLGGGRPNSISVHEAGARLEELLGAPFRYEYLDEPRRGDHICYISDLGRIRSDYSDWEITISLDAILEQLVREPMPTAAG